MYCHNCGTQLEDGAKICSECGQAVNNNNGNGYGRSVKVKVSPHQMEDRERIIYVEQAHKQRKKSHWFLWLFFLLAIAALSFLYLSPITQNLYVYSKIQFRSDNPITEQEKETFIELFENNYLYQNEDGEYYIADLESGLEFALSDFQEAAPETIAISINISGNYAYIEMIDLPTDDRVSISFFKASLMERVKFVSRLFYW